MIEYRDLGAAEAHTIEHIDRSEFIDGEYRVVDGGLVLEARSIEAPGWSRDNVATYVDRVTEILSRGGRAIGARSNGRLVGFGTLDATFVGGDGTLMLLDMLYVDRAHRGRGIGREFLRRIVAIARSCGAKALYISATPTRATVDAYVQLGAVLIETPDPVLFAQEPKDVHLRLDL